MNRGLLTFFCGKMGSGKSTKANEIALENNAILLSEDEWLSSLYPGKILSLDDYIEYSNRLKPQIKKIIQSSLSIGINVVMDFPANTPSQRKWFRKILSEVEAPHSLIYIDLPDDICLEQIKKRRQENPETKKIDTFDKVTKHFVPPTADEGFNVTKITNDHLLYER